MESKVKECGMFIIGIVICFAVAGLSVLAESMIPGGLLGASIIALFMGTLINTFFHPAWIKPALKFASKKILKVTIVLLSASLLRDMRSQNLPATLPQRSSSHEQ